MHQSCVKQPTHPCFQPSPVARVQQKPVHRHRPCVPATQPFPKGFRKLVVAAAVEQVDVAIIGGGPGGMATALSIQRAAPQLRVRVYERARRLLPVGYMVGLTDNGQSCIKAMGEDVWEEFSSNRFGPWDKVRAYINNVPKAGTPEAAKGPAETVLQPPNPVRRTIRNCRWHNFQAGFTKFLAPGTVELGHSFVELSDPGEQGSHVTLRLMKTTTPADGQASSSSQEEVEVQAQLVIGADGNQSAVRQAILGDGPPEFLDSVTWRGAAPSAASIGWPFPYEEGRVLLFLYDQQTVSKHATRTQVGPWMQMEFWGGPNEPVVWSVFSPWKAGNLGAINRRYYGNEGTTGVYTKADRHERCLDALRIGEFEVERFPQFAINAIKSTPPEILGEHALFTREADTCRTWVKGRVGLLGDAAHLVTPYLGQGTNMTMEDAVELARSISKHGPTPEALKEYEAVRAPRVHEIHNVSTWMAKRYWYEGVREDELGWHAKHPHVIGWRAEPLQPSKAVHTSSPASSAPAAPEVAGTLAPLLDAATPAAAAATA